jgi:hypothetical protein
MGRRILVIGSLGTIFIHSYTKLLQQAGWEVDVVNTSDSFGALCFDSGARVVSLYSKRKVHSYILKHVKRALNFVGMDRSRLVNWVLAKRAAATAKSGGFLPQLDQLLSEHHYDLVFGFWSTTVQKELDYVRARLGRRSKYVLGINTYPVRDNATALDKVLDRVKDTAFFNGFDGLMYATEPMRDQLRALGVAVHHELVSSDRLVKDAFFEESVPKRDAIIFLGNTEFLDRSIDDVRAQIYELSRFSEIHCQSPSKNLRPDPRIRIYDPFSYQDILDGTFARYLATFQAAVLLYGDHESVRVKISYPTRFALATVARIPVLVHRDLFPYLESDFPQKVLRYNTWEEIPELLKTAEPVASCNVNNGRFEGFLEGVLCGS